MGKISVSQAIDKAWALANAQLKGKIDKKNTPFNCGDNNDFVFNDDEGAIKNGWEKKKFSYKGIDYKGKIIVSSGEAKFDLRLVEGSKPAVFNYHVPFKVDTSKDEAAKAQSAADKKHAEAEKVRMAKEKEVADAKKKAADAAAKTAEDQKKKRDQAMATAWNALAKKPKDKAAWAKEWLEKNKSKKF